MDPGGMIPVESNDVFEMGGNHQPDQDSSMASNLRAFSPGMMKLEHVPSSSFPGFGDDVKLFQPAAQHHEQLGTDCSGQYLV